VRSRRKATAARGLRPSSWPSRIFLAWTGRTGPAESPQQPSLGRFSGRPATGHPAFPARKTCRGNLSRSQLAHRQFLRNFLNALISTAFGVARIPPVRGRQVSGTWIAVIRDRRGAKIGCALNQRSRRNHHADAVLGSLPHVPVVRQGSSHAARITSTLPRQSGPVGPPSRAILSAPPLHHHAGSPGCSRRFRRSLWPPPSRLGRFGWASKRRALGVGNAPGSLEIRSGVGYTLGFPSDSPFTLSDCLALVAPVSNSRGERMASRRRGKGRRKVGRKKRRMRSRIRHRKK
jgi:hypothetical protein